MLQAGDRIANWVVVRPLGEGGMGSVYLCRSAMSDRILAAVKVLKPSHIEDEMGRFVREVEALDALRHHAVVRVKGFGDDPARGLLWLAMEYVEGEDLEQRRQRGPMDPSEAGRVFAEVASGLADAHANRICHRDIKPANIVLCKDGSARIVDFGIAVQSDRTRLTDAGLVVGTPAYMAPEIFDGESPDLAKADIYALGQVLHEALIGAAAFPADPAMSTGQSMMRLIGRKTRGEPLDPGPGAPDALREVVRRATAPRTTDRYQTMADMAAALTAAQEASAPQTTWVRDPRPEQARPTTPRPVPNERATEPPAEESLAPPLAAPASRAAGRRTVAVAAAGGSVVALVVGLVALVGLVAISAWWFTGGHGGRVDAAVQEPVYTGDAGLPPAAPPGGGRPGSEDVQISESPEATRDDMTVGEPKPEVVRAAPPPRSLPTPHPVPDTTTPTGELVPGSSAHLAPETPVPGVAPPPDPEVASTVSIRNLTGATSTPSPPAAGRVDQTHETAMVEPTPAPASVPVATFIVLKEGAVGAILYIDGQRLGPLPARVTLSEGMHQFTIETPSGSYTASRNVALQSASRVINLAD